MANPIAPQSLAFDNSGNLLIAGHHGNTATYTSGIQMVAKATCASSCPYHYATLGAGDLYTVAGEGMRGINRTPAITFSFGVDGWGLSVDAQGNLVVGANGEVLFVNEQTSPVTRYGQSLAAQQRHGRGRDRPHRLGHLRRGHGEHAGPRRQQART